MAERRPPGFNIPLNFATGAEVHSIPKRIRAAAIGVWALAGNYSATELFDGYVPADMLKLFGCTPAIREALKSTINKKGELSPLWVEARNGGVQLTNWPKWQRTSDEVTSYRADEAERKRNARKAKREAPTSNDVRTSGRTPGGHTTSVRPDDRDPKTETETETKESVAPPSGGHPHTPPSPHCQKHPGGTLEDCRFCLRARQAFEAWEAGEQAAKQLGLDASGKHAQYLAELRAACTDCDERGHRLGPDGLPADVVEICTHPSLTEDDDDA